MNNVFKDHWGRPRPADIVNFGGTRKLSRQFWEIGEAGPGKSFSSGHAAVGFFFLFAPFFILRKSHRRAAIAFLLFRELLFGFFMGAGRMIAGGSFSLRMLYGQVWLLI